MKLMRILLLPLLLGAACLLVPSCKKKESKASREHISDFYGAFRDYQEENGGQWPEKFEELKPYLPNWEELIVNPNTGDNPGYQYTPPPPSTSADPDEDTSGNAVILTQLRNGQPDLSLRKLHKSGRTSKGD